MQHIPHQSAEGEDRCESNNNNNLGLSYVALYGPHIGDEKLSDNPNWLPVGQCGFGEQFMHLSKSVIGKDLKKV